MLLSTIRSAGTPHQPLPYSPGRQSAGQLRTTMSVTHETMAPSAAQSLPVSSPCSSPPRVQFMDLPLEIRNMVWEFALTSRVCHVEHVHLHYEDAGPHAASGPPQYGRLKFYTNHPPPVITAVCTESRRTAWRTGCVLFRRPDNDAHPGVWF